MPWGSKASDVARALPKPTQCAATEEAIVLPEGIEDLVLWEPDREGDGGETSATAGGASANQNEVDRMLTRW